MKIAYQGAQGSFSHQTALHLARDLLPCNTFEEVYKAVEDGSAELGLLPIENTLAGVIYETIHLLAKGKLYIVGEMVTQIEHNLLGMSTDAMEVVHSHPQALAQCDLFFQKHPDLKKMPHYDTAGAALEVARQNDPRLGAIASLEAAKISGLKILKRNIQDEKENFTRFLLLSKIPKRGSKCSLVLTLEHEPGRLAETLLALKEADINLTSIVSLPMKNKPFEYLFLMDMRVPNGFEIPKLNAKTLKILGFYETLRDESNS